MFEKIYSLKTDYSDGKAFADNATLLELFTSVSKAHVDAVGVDLPEDIVWMVLDWKLRIETRPKIGESYTFRTWVSDLNRAFSVRCYDIIDAQGCKLAQASSRWVLANINTRKLFRMPADITEMYGCDKGLSDIENEPFIKNIAKNLTPVKSSRAEISDDMIDGNGHVHNTVYSTWAESVLPDGVNTDSVDISYRKEIDRNEKPVLDYCIYDNKKMVLIKTQVSSAPNAIVLYGN